jgi:hypothetical protein
MRNHLKPLLLLGVTAALVFGFAVGVTAQAQLAWVAITSGGQTGMSSTNYGAGLSVGQPTVGPAASTSYQVVLGVWNAVTGTGTGVTEIPTGELPETFALAQNYPNPFNPVTQIAFDLPRATHAKLEIYNIVGRKVITLLDDKRSAGSYVADWDGRDDSGNSVASGFYLYRLKTDDAVATRKMILLK